MRQVRIENIEDGDRLGEPIFQSNGTLLLAGGVALTRFHVDALRQRGLRAVFIEDERTKDIQPKRPVNIGTRNTVASDLRESFQSVAGRLEPLREIAIGADTKDLEGESFRRDIRKAVDPGLLVPLIRDADSLLAALDEGCAFSGLDSLREHDAYTFEHSVDVTILGLLLARKAGWTGSRLRHFGIGLLLHDIGKLFVEPEVLTKDGSLTDEEFQSIKRHPQLGYTLIRELMPGLGPLTAHVAWQHHERQDGTGYPRGLRGNNRLDENAPGQLHEFGSVAGVADVFDALVSNRPYRAGYPVDHVLRLITGVSGTHLNREAVGLLKQVVAPFPLCTSIRVQNGSYAGWAGVVSAENAHRIDRPRIRLLNDDAGRDIDPIELDLAREPSLMIEAEPLEDTLASAAA